MVNLRVRSPTHLQINQKSVRISRKKKHRWNKQSTYRIDLNTLHQHMIRTIESKRREAITCHATHWWRRKRITVYKRTSHSPSVKSLTIAYYMLEIRCFSWFNNEIDFKNLEESVQDRSRWIGNKPTSVKSLCWMDERYVRIQWEVRVSLSLHWQEEWVNGRCTWTWICQGANCNSHGDVEGGSDRGGGTGSRSVGDRVKWGWRVLTFAAGVPPCPLAVSGLGHVPGVLASMGLAVSRPPCNLIAPGVRDSIQTVLVSIMFLAVNCEVRATSHTRLTARDCCTSSSLVGGKGGAGPSSLLRTMLEGPTKYVSARWMEKSTWVSTWY